MKHHLCGTAMAVLAAAIAQQAFAADEAVTAAPVEATTAASADAALASTTLNEVVVTATKRETNLQETPIAISVVGSENLADRHVQSLMDLADGAIPSLRVATFEARQSAVTIGIRGIVPLDANQPAREQGVGVYVDGVYLGRQQGLGAALLDVEQIEVLKGPQGTLFGRNTEGGAVSIVTKAPTGVAAARVTAGVGNYGAYNADAHVDLPRIGDFAFKVDGALQHQDATTKNPLAGQTGWNYFDRQGLHAAARWTPSESFTADLAYDVGKDSNSPFYSLLLNYNPLNMPIGPASGSLPAGSIRPLPPIVQVEGEERMSVADIGVPQQPSVDRTQGVSMRLSWRPADHIEIRSISAFREVSTDQWDNSGGAHRVPAFAANGAFSRYSLSVLGQHQYSQELQLVGSAPRLDYVAGVYYFNEKAKENAATPSTNQWNATGTAYTILDPTPTQPGRRSIDRASVAYAESYAVYGQATYTPAILDDRLHLTLGGRFTKDDKHGSLFVVNNTATSYSFEEKNDRFNPLVTLAFDAAEDVNLYAKWATGYRSGGASSRSLTFRSFGPEDVDSYEVGMKSELFERRLRLNAAAFYMDRTGSQIDFSLVTPQPNGSTRNTLETINAPGATKIKGVELEANAVITDGLTLNAAYAYTDTHIPDTVNPFNNQLQQVFIVFTPKNTFSLGLDYSRPIGMATLRAHIDGNYADATQTFDQTPVKNDSSFIVNARLALADLPMGDTGGTVTMSAWARNLLDEAHVYRRDPANRATLGDYGNLNAPRTFGLELSLKY